MKKTVLYLIFLFLFPSVIFAQTCSDGTKNGQETDVDCGGSCPTKCATNNQCSIAADCAGNVCVSNPYSFLLKWGSHGTGNGQFIGAVDVDIDSVGNVYVSDTSNHRIQKFSSTGTFITKWGSQGTGNGQFSYPMGIVVDSADNLYVSDSDNKRIQKFSSSGAFITKWGSQGTGNGQFMGINDIAIDSAGNVYVLDVGNYRIQKFSSTGAFITKWGSQGTGDGQFGVVSSRSITTDSSNNIYVVDTGNNRIQKFSSSGTFITKWGTNGPENGQFNLPSGITVDSAGNVYVVDTVNYRIQKFSSSGTFITKWGSYGMGDTQFGNPYAITIDNGGNIYITDIFSERVQKFGTVKTCAAPSCTDGVKNGAETDVDCGGSCTTKCGTGKKCNGNGDCVTNNCDTVTKMCVATGSLVISTTPSVEVRKGTPMLGTTDAQGQLSLSLSTDNHALTFTKTGYQEITKTVTVNAGATTNLEFIYCTDGDNDKYGTGEGCLGTDCDDANANANPGIAGTCGLPSLCKDDDDDGYGVVNTDLRLCLNSATEADCDDNDNARYPANPEICDNKDNNCNNQIDEGLSQTWYLDADTDGYYPTNGLKTQCANPGNGWSTTQKQASDCNDNDPAAKPSATEACNNKDDNCNGQVDENIPNCCAGIICQAGTTCQNSVCVPVTGTLTITTSESVQVKEGTTLLGTTSSQPLTFSLSPGSHTLTFIKNGYREVTKSVTVTAGSTATLSFVYCTDGDNDKYGTGEGCLGADCDDTNQNIKPGIVEQGYVCSDTKDNDCNGDIDYDGARIPGKKGDVGCPVGVTDISVSSDKPIENSKVVVKCTSTVTNVNSVTVKLDNVLCSYTSWENLNAVFSCNVGAFTGNPKTIICSIDTTKSTKTGTDQNKQITVIPSDCSKFGSGDACNADSRCSWCGACSGKKYSGGSDRCIAKGSCSYTCTKDKCGATCDPTLGGWTNYVCDTICQDASTLLIRANVQNTCRDDCTSTTNTCPTGTPQSCGTPQCDTLKHLVGSCNNQCVEAGQSTDGTPATCSSCALQCTCAQGYVDKNKDASDGCECEVKTEICDGIDNNCKGDIDEGLSQTWYLDADTDGYYPTNGLKTQCANPGTGWTTTQKLAGDCNDNDPAAKPSATEACNNKDDNCNGQVDENIPNCCAGISCPSDQKCKSTTKTCVSCLIDTDCASGKKCEPTTNTCVTCYDNTHCLSGQECKSNQCKQICSTFCSVGKILDADGTCKSTSTTPSSGCCFEGLAIGINGECTCKTGSDNVCPCDNMPDSEKSRCISLCASQNNRDGADPDCLSADPRLTNQKVSISVPAENVITLEKLATYRGKPVKVKVVMWSKEK